MSPANQYEAMLEELGPVAPQAVEDNPYAATLKEQTTREEAAFRVAQQAAQQTTPDRAAEAHRLSDWSGLPPDVVERNFDEIKKRLDTSPESYAHQMRDTPALTTWLADPHHAAVAQDDTDTLGDLEWLIKAPGRAFAQTLNRQEYATLRYRSMLGGPLTRAEQDQMAAAKYQVDRAGDLGAGTSRFRQAITGVGSLLANQVPLISRTVTGATYGGAAALGAGLAGATTVFGLPLAALVGAGASVGMFHGVLQSTFEQESAGAYDEYLTFKDESGQPLNPAIARIAALATGAINAPIEAGAQELLLRSIPGIDRLSSAGVRSLVKQALATPTVRAALGSLAATYGKTLAGETAQEVAQRAVTILSGELAKIASGQTIPLKSPGAIAGELGEEAVGAATSFAIPLLAGPMIALPGTVQETRQIAAHAEAQEAWFTALGTGIKNSKTFARLPAATQAFLAHATKDGPLEHVYVDPGVFTTYWQSKGVDPALVAEQLLGNAEAYPEAVRTGEALVIPTATYAVTLAHTEHNSFFKRELRFAPGEMNAREKQAYSETLEAAMAEATAAVAAAPPTTEPTAEQTADPVYASIYTQLIAAGRSRVQAHADATMTAHFYQALGPLGIDPVAYFQRRGWIITAPATVEEATLRTRAAARPARAAGVSSEETTHAATDVSATPGAGPGLSDTADEQSRPDQGGVGEGRGDGDGVDGGGVSAAADVGSGGADAASAAESDADVYVRQPAEHTTARVTPEVSHELVRILDEMETFPYVGRTWTWLEGKKTGNAAGGAADIVAGMGGAKVYDDILYLAPVNRATSGARKGQPARKAHGSRGDVIAAIRTLLETGTVTTNLGEGVLRVAERRAAGDWQDLSKPELPHATALVAPVALTDALADAIDDALAAGEGEGDISFDVGELELESGAAPGAVDVLETGELQPRLPGAESVRDTEQATPGFDAPFSLTPEAAPVPGVQGTKLTFEQARRPTTAAQAVEDVAALDAMLKVAQAHAFPRRRDLKLEMQRRVQAAAAATGASLDPATPAGHAYLVQVGVRDALTSLDSNANAVGWYDVKTRQALAVAALIHPELDTDPNARFAFTYALAIYSYGLEINKNFQLAEAAYQAYAQTGLLPTDLGIGTARTQINTHAALFNRQVAEWGLDQFRQMMVTRFTVNELARLGFKPDGEHTSTVVRGAAMIGPKIGNGFFSNLNGFFDALTMDRWLMRTWGRWTGTLFYDNTTLVPKGRAALQDSVAALLARAPAQAAAFGALVGVDLATVDTAAEWDALAVEIRRASSHNAKRATMAATQRGDEVRRNGNILAANLDAQKEAPANPTERNQMRAVFADVLAALQHLGYTEMTTADLQAVLWYAERRLYDVGTSETEEEGYNDLEAPDYANAASTLAHAQGISPAAIDAALSSVGPHGGQAVRQPGAGGRGVAATATATAHAGGGGGVQGAAGGFTPEAREAFLARYAKAPLARSVHLPPSLGFYQSAVPAPTFYSRLTRAVETSTLAKASGAQWKATIANAKTGINRDEFAYARVADLADGTVYTKADVLAYLAANTLSLEDVTLGEVTGPTNEEVRTRADEIYQAAVDAEHERLVDADEGYAEEIRYGASFNEEEGAWEAEIEGDDLGEWFDTQEEAEAALDAAVQARREELDESRQEVLADAARDNVDYDDAYNKALAELERDRGDAGERVQYAEYVEPGAVPGSYREVFLTVPQVRAEAPVATLTGLTAEELYDLRMNGWTATVDAITAHLVAGREQAARDRVAEVLAGFETLLATGRAHPDVLLDQRAFQKLSRNLTFGTVVEPVTWVDGHDAYSDIPNPVVRLRFNERSVPGVPITRRRLIQPHQPFADRGDTTTHYKVVPKGNERFITATFDTLAEAEAFVAASPTFDEPTTQRVLFLEEVQPPHADQPMPPLLRKHWREIGFKWALRHASEQGFDVLAWTTGAQQAARYSLEKQVERIAWGPGVERGEAGTHVTIKLLGHGGRNINFHVVDGIVQREGADAQAERWADAPLENIIGKDVAAKITGERSGELAGEGLKIGGEGLKRLYDTDFKAVVQKVPAVKQAGGRVTTVPLRSAADINATYDITETSPGVWRLVDRAANQFIPDAPTFRRGADAEQWLRERGKLDVDVPALALTPAIKAAVLGGQPLFQPAPAEGPLAAVTFTPAAIHVQLFAGANPSSFQHEAAHVFLELRGHISDDLRSRDPATLTPAQQRFVADYDATLRWLGVSERRQITRAQHEYFARSFEAYLREGRAPSLELRSVFAQFRGWLLTLYQSLKDLDVVLTPEVRTIFDRMIASDAAIAEAAAEPQVQPLFTTAASAGMTEEAFAHYQTLVQAASDQAKAELSGRLYREWERERSAQWTAARERIRAAVTAEVQQEPVYRARAAMRTGTYPDGTPLVPGQPPTPITVNLNPLLPAEEGAIALDAAAELFGFTSGDELAEALRTAPTQRRAIAAKTDARLRAELGDVALNRAVLREQAEAVVYGAGRQTVVQAELKALTAGLQRGVIPPAALLRQHARDRIRATRVRDLRPGLFLVAAQRASARAFDLKESDRAGAVQAKQQELLNLALYREAVQARDTAEATATWVRTQDREAPRRRLGKAGASYLEQWDGLLERFEFKRVPQSRLDQRAAVAAWAAAQEADNLPVDLPALLLDESKRTNYANLTVDELADVREGLEHLTHLARLKNTLLTAQRNRDFTVAVDTITTSLRAHKPSTALPLEFLPKDVKARKVMAWFASHKKLANLVRAMDGYQDGGPLWEYLLQPINAAATREAALNQEATIAIGRLLTRAYSGRDLAQLHTTSYIPAIKGSLSKEARLMVALNWGNEGNRQRLRDGRQWTDAQVTAILDTLDARDVRFVQDVWDYIDTYWPAIAAKQRRVAGVAPEKVEATPFVTQHGTSRGGYFPLVYDGRLSARAGSFIDVDQANLQKQAAYAKATTRRGHTEARAAQVKEPIRLELSAFYGHVEQVIHDLSHHEMLIDVGRLLGDRRLQQAIYETHGDIIYRQLKDALVDIAYGARPASNAAEQAINYLRQGTTVAGLAWNVWTAVQQPMGVFNGMARVGPTWVLRGMTHMLRDVASMESTARWVYERSEMMRLRHTTQQREISELRNTVSQAGGWFDTALRRASKDTLTQQDLAASYFWLIGQAQRLADLPTWIGQYEKSMAAGETEARAVALAEQAVLDAQGGGQIKDLAQVQRGSATFKLFTNFYSYGSLLYNQTADAYGQTNFRRAGSVGQFAGNLLLLYVFPALASVLLAHAFGRDDDEEGFLAAMGREMVGQALNTMVLLRELGSLARLGANRGYGGPAGTRPIGAAIELATQAEQGELDRGLLRATEDVAGMLFRLPLAQVQRSIDGFVALQNGQTQNPLALLTGPPRK